MEAQAFARPKKLIERIGLKYGIDAEKLLNTLKSTAFRQRSADDEVSNEQMMALLVVAEQYNLNPFTKELYAYPDKNMGIVPVVSIDGWVRIINSHQKYDGMDITDAPTKSKPDGCVIEAFDWCEVKMYHKDRNRPTVIREYLDEVYRKPFRGTGKNGPYTKDGPWQTHPKRMLRHKTIIQCARMAFGFSGIYDQDEAERIIDMGSAVIVDTDGQPVHTQEKNSNQLLLEQKQADPFIEQLIKRAKEDKTWETAYAFVGERFKGDVAEYAKQRLRDAEIELMPSALDSIAAKTSTEGVAESHNGNPAKVPSAQAIGDLPGMEFDDIPY